LSFCEFKVIFCLYTKIRKESSQACRRSPLRKRRQRMFQRILVPLDGSQRAEQALPVAARIARSTGGSILVLRVVSIPSDFQVYSSVTPAVVQSALEAEQEEAESYLAGLTNQSVLAGLPVHTQVVVGTDQAARSILSTITDQHCDLVVICSHGYTGIKRWALGSVAEKVVHLSPVPVLLLRADHALPLHITAQQQGVIRALVPLDGSAEAKAALEPAAFLVAALAAPGKGALHLMRVVTGTSTHEPDPERQKAALAKVRHYLSTTVEHIRERLIAPSVAPLNLSITWSAVPDGDVATSIVNMAEIGEDTEGAGTPERCDLIAMATHGYSGWQRVLHATKVPMLIVRSNVVH
jgi:nucleotide-binding universal stress UspA family protein